MKYSIISESIYFDVHMSSMNMRISTTFIGTRNNILSERYLPYFPGKDLFSQYRPNSIGSRFEKRARTKATSVAFYFLRFTSKILTFDSYFPRTHRAGSFFFISFRKTPCDGKPNRWLFPQLLRGVPLEGIVGVAVASIPTSRGATFRQKIPPAFADGMFFMKWWAG